jgi:hypothetical protein
MWPETTRITVAKHMYLGVKRESQGKTLADAQTPTAQIRTVEACSPRECAIVLVFQAKELDHVCSDAWQLPCA